MRDIRSYPIDCDVDGPISHCHYETGLELGVAKASLLSLPGAVLGAIMSLLQPSDVARIAMACKALHKSAEDISCGGSVLCIEPSCQPHSCSPSGNLDWRFFPVIVKTHKPGFGTWMASEAANTCNTLWQVRLEAFKGVRLEIGLGTQDSMGIGVMARNRTWLFDCWGRKVHGDNGASYGGIMQEGDVISILYERKSDTLTFLHNGISMGQAFRGLSGDPQEHRLLFPVIHFPFFPLDAVRIMQPSMDDAAKAQELLLLKHGRGPLQWKAPPHPDNGKVVIETRCHYTNYRLQVDVQCQTVGSLRQLLSEVEGFNYDADECDFLFAGKSYPASTPLTDCGVDIDPVSGTHLTRIQVYFPVEVS